MDTGELCDQLSPLLPLHPHSQPTHESNSKFKNKTLGVGRNLSTTTATQHHNTTTVIVQNGVPGASLPEGFKEGMASPTVAGGFYRSAILECPQEEISWSPRGSAGSSLFFQTRLMWFGVIRRSEGFCQNLQLVQNAAARKVTWLCWLLSIGWSLNSVEAIKSFYSSTRSSDDKNHPIWRSTTSP